MTSPNESPESVTRPIRSNVEVVKQVYEAFRQRDLGAALGLLAATVQIDQPSEVPWGGHYDKRDRCSMLVRSVARWTASRDGVQRARDGGAPSRLHHTLIVSPRW